MPISQNEIRTRAAAFVNKWKDKAPTAREEADAQTFENEFFEIFGISRTKVATFERKVRLNTDGFINNTELFDKQTGGASSGYIDLLWEGQILIEMKSPGKDLGKAYEQAKEYAKTLKPNDLPQVILVCDFVNFHYYDLTDNAKLWTFSLMELPEHIELFYFLAGYRNVDYKKPDHVNIEAAEMMGRLHDRLKETGYSGHQLEVYLVRIMFCFFADDTGIFEHDHFMKYIIERTNTDGSDLALHLAKIFEILNTPNDKRLKTLDEQLNQVPYVDGALFEEQLKTADFDSKMREALIDCGRLDWSRISPAIFGAMFQSVMDNTERHDIGAHYTSEENILKVIHPLFLDNLRKEFKKIKSLTSHIRKVRLGEFKEKLSRLKFLDPACGCGNFLVISYRELRLLEMEVINELLGFEKEFDIDLMVKVNVNQFYGIEIEEFPVEIAKTAMWLVDHQMNRLISERFGRYYIRIPLKTSATILNTNALTTDWETIVPKNELSYIFGNPPFMGANIMNREQKKDIALIFDELNKRGILDYVTCWYKKTACYIKKTKIECAFVSTNSICQGEHVPVLWPLLMNNYGIKINFAHQTFKWSNEARDKAAVYCVIIGFSLVDRKEKKLFLYETVTGKPIENTANQINAYLMDAPVIFIMERSKPISKNVFEMNMGNSPIDDGNYLLSQEERDVLIKNEPSIKNILRPFIAAEEFIHNKRKYCIWLNNVKPEAYNFSKEILKRIERVAEFRKKSKRSATQKRSVFPSLFSEIRQPDTDYILIPRVTSEKRKYIPMGFIKKNVIAGDTTLTIPGADIYHFGILTSAMHMAWMRYVCGRLKSDYRYSKEIVYNNFPWPTESSKQKNGNEYNNEEKGIRETKEVRAARLAKEKLEAKAIKEFEKNKTAIENAAQSVLDARALFSDSSLAALYDPLTMPPELVKAHQTLDKAVDRAYGRTFDNDAQRVACLFELYQKLSSGLFMEVKKRGKGRKVTA
jgi:hypothetical protein